MLVPAIVALLPLFVAAQYYNPTITPPPPAAYPPAAPTAPGDSVALPFPVGETVPRGYEELLEDELAYDLSTPSNIKTTAEYDPATGYYIVRTRVGDFDIATPFMLSQSQYNDWQLRRSLQQYYKERNMALMEKKEKEPFNIDNWVLLSKIQFQRQDAEEAVSAADYAAALDPSFRPPKIMKALGMVVTGENRPEAIETLRNLMHEQPDDTVAMRGLIEALRQEGRKDEAVDECLRMLSADATSLPSILPQILSMGMTDHQADIVATLIYDSFGDDEARYIEIARGLMQQNLGSGAAFILERFDLRYGICIGAELMIEVYYRLRRHEDLIAFFKKCCDRNRNPDGSGQSAVPSGSCGESESAGITSRMPLQLSSASILFFASASLLAGDYATAALVSEMAIATAYSNFDELDIYDRISYKGMLNIMRDINRYAANPSTIPSTPDFDPITDRERI